MKRLGVKARRLFAPISAHFARNIGDGGEPLDERLEIEAGPPDQDWHAALTCRFGDGRLRRFEPAADRKGLVCRDGAVKAMRGSGLVGFARPRCEQAKLVIELHRIGVDDGTAEPIGKGEGHGGLAARGRPGDKNCLRFSAHASRRQETQVVGTATNLSPPLESERSSNTVRRPDFFTASSRASTSRGCFTFSCVTSTMTSPGFTSFCAAGLSGLTSVMMTPSIAFPMPY